MNMSAIGRNAQIASSEYFSRAYNSKERFASFWHQIDETLKFEPSVVLEVGPGAGFVTWFLRHSGIDVKTLDIDETVSPDLVGSVTEIPLESGSVDVVLISEVLEHLPFPDVERALAELARVARSGVVISVPDDRPYVGFSYPLYFSPHLERARRAQPSTRRELARQLVTRKFRFRDYLWNRVVPYRWAYGGRAFEPKIPIPHQTREHEFDGQHYWELGTEGYPVARIVDAIRQRGMTLVCEFRVPEMPWHHFFVAAVSTPERSR
jgi:SAM-dependent methyltransferase